MEPQKVIVCIDGFNFYFGLKKNARWKKYYWLNIVKLFEKFMRPNQELVAVKYFSARVNDIDKSRRQNAFFQANLENPKFNLILGKYLKKDITCFNCRNVIHTYEEKETDVRIATQIVADALKGNFDLAIVVSADSDMIPALELAMEANKRIVVYFPPHQFSNNLASLSSTKPIQLKRYEGRFKECLFPDTVHLNKVDFDLTIPPKWKDFQTK